jgi:hypothetical protein
MKQQWVILSAIVLLFSICLSGCQESNNQNGNQPETAKKKIIGDWSVVTAGLEEETYSFYENNTAKDVFNQLFEGQPITTISWYDYTIDNTTLCLLTKNLSADNISLCYSYVFSENATRLTLSFNNVEVMDLVKIR